MAPALIRVTLTLPSLDAARSLRANKLFSVAEILHTNDSIGFVKSDLRAALDEMNAHLVERKFRVWCWTVPPGTHVAASLSVIQSRLWDGVDPICTTRLASLVEVAGAASHADAVKWCEEQGYDPVHADIADQLDVQAKRLLHR